MGGHPTTVAARRRAQVSRRTAGDVGQGATAIRTSVMAARCVGDDHRAEPESRPARGRRRRGRRGGAAARPARPRPPAPHRGQLGGQRSLLDQVEGVVVGEREDAAVGSRPRAPGPGRAPSRARGAGATLDAAVDAVGRHLLHQGGRHAVAVEGRHPGVASGAAPSASKRSTATPPSSVRLGRSTPEGLEGDRPADLVARRRRRPRRRRPTSWRTGVSPTAASRSRAASSGERRAGSERPPSAPRRRVEQLAHGPWAAAESSTSSTVGTDAGLAGPPLGVARRPGPRAWAAASGKAKTGTLAGAAGRRAANEPRNEATTGLVAVAATSSSASAIAMTSPSSDGACSDEQGVDRPGRRAGPAPRPAAAAGPASEVSSRGLPSRASGRDARAQRPSRTPTSTGASSRPAAHARVGGQHRRAPEVRQHRHPAPGRQRLVDEDPGHVEELLEGVDPDDPRLREQGVGHPLAGPPGVAAGPGRPGPPGACRRRRAATPSALPAFTATIGFTLPTRRAMRAKFRGLPNDSR